MRAAVRDFYDGAPVQRQPLPSWPADFDPDWITVYAAEPLLPEVLECEGCPLAWTTCRPGRFGRPECGERELVARRSPHRMSFEELSGLILAELARRPCTLYDLLPITGATFDSGAPDSKSPPFA